MKVPLYMMSAGDLGLEPRQVETKLQGILDMCTRWNAILLLDEADVFLEERSLHELERNKLVSIFLRVLEYYEGIMFLTTNRVQTFDAAFQSRIHISLKYPELDTASRKSVWQNFIQQHDVAQAASRERGPSKPKASAAQSSDVMDGTISAESDEKLKDTHMKQTLPHAFTSKDIDKLSDLTVNGRQIKVRSRISQSLHGLLRPRSSTAIIPLVQCFHEIPANSCAYRTSSKPLSWWQAIEGRLWVTSTSMRCLK